MKKRLPLFVASLAVFAGLTAGLVKAAAAPEKDIPYEMNVSTDGFSNDDLKGWSGLYLEKNGKQTTSIWKINGIAPNLALRCMSGSLYDAWLVSPAFEFKAGNQYEITFDMKPYGSSSEGLAIAILDDKTAEAAEKAEVLWSVDYTYKWNGDPKYTMPDGTNNRQNVTVKYTCKSDGIRYVGLRDHSTGNYSVDGAYIYGFSIKALRSAQFPAAVGNLTVTPGDAGALTAKVAFTAPTKDKLDNDLTAPLTVKIFRNEETEAAGTIENVEAGSAQAWTDEAAPAGTVTYTVKAYDGETEGEPASASAFIGEDTPLAVTDLTASVTPEGKVTVKWTAPAGGVNGAYLNVAALAYKVSRIEGTAVTSINPEVADCSFSDDFVPAAGQTAVSYSVVPVSSVGEGAPAESNPVGLGAAYATPFKESFGEAAYKMSGWFATTVVPSTSSQAPEWLPVGKYYYEHATEDGGTDVVAVPHDDDAGLIKVNTNYMSQGAQTRLTSPLISLKGMVNPALTFYFWLDDNTTAYITEGGRGDDRIQLQIAEGNGEFADVEGELYHRHSDKRGWLECRVSLTDFIDKDIRLGFLATSGGAGAMCLDDISLVDGPAVDFALGTLSGPAKLKASDEGRYTVEVTNNGPRPSAAYSVALYAGEKQVAVAEGVEVPAQKSAQMAVVLSPAMDAVGQTLEIEARVIAAGDEDADNDVSANKVNTLVTEPLFPAVAAVDASQDGSDVILSWNAADKLSDEALLIEDDFENYEPFDTKTIGSYALLDLDKLPTYAPQWREYPNMGRAMAFQVYNPASFMADADNFEAYAPLSGSQYLAAMGTQPNSDNSSTTANDWIFSPLLNGRSQTITFWSRHYAGQTTDEFGDTYTNEYPEQLTVLFTEDTESLNPADYEQASATITTKSAWTKHEVTLPAGAKRFAIRHFTTDGFILMIDDLTFYRSVPTEEEAGLLGYNVYRDGELLNDAPLTDRTFTDENAPEGSHEYVVKAVYPKGESHPSDAALIQVAGASDAVAAGVVSVSAARGEIVIAGACGLDAVVCNAAGVVLSAGRVPSDRFSVSCAPGVHIVRVDAKTYKVIVK